MSGRPGQSRILQAASRIDGAIIFNRQGQIVDVASMVADPEPEARASVGVNSLVRFGGARSAAAGNASIRGLKIKVSEDGPVVFGGTQGDHVGVAFRRWG